MNYLDRLITNLVFLSPLLHYIVIFNIRIIVFTSIIPIFYYIVRNNFKININFDLIIIITGILITFLLSAPSSDWSTFSATLIFSLILSWPFFVSKKVIIELTVEELQKKYLLCAFIFSLTIIAQYILNNFFSIKIGHLEYYFQRVAYASSWLDFSFASLFLVSAIPFINYKKSKVSAIILIGSILMATFITSARTGIAAIFLAIAFYIFYLILLDVIKFKLNKKTFYLILFLLTSSILFFYLKEILLTRTYTLGDSGRVSGLNTALSIFYKNLLFGYNFNIDKYSTYIGVIPHNVFIFSLTFGGLIYFLYISVFLLNFGIRSAKTNTRLFISFLTVFFGIQFIPSFFSTYFLALLISISIFSRRKTVLLKANTFLK